MYLFIKRILDILIGIIGVVLMIPVTIYVIGLKIYYKDNNNLFFVQKRIGRDGKIFEMYKYQTMIENADKILQDEMKRNSKIKQEYQENKKLADDFRVTKVGKKIRENHIDEWPQFINVLLGQMSIIGPRPYLLAEKEEIKYYSEIIQVKPGITGLWQTDNKGNTFEVRNKLDKQYTQKISFINDLKIFCKTIQSFLK